MKRWSLLPLLLLGWASTDGAAVAAQPDRGEALRVEVEVAGGVHHVGQGFELRVGVSAAGRRPEVDPPTMVGADVWLVRNDELKPISVSEIGSVVGQSNVFVSRYRVVPRRSGTLEVPSVRAHLGHRTGRSRPVRLTVRPLPVEGRPADFLGGVGAFTLAAQADPRSVRVGQELEYRITVTGPAAWGMAGRPELKRFDRLPLGLRIGTKPVQTTNEPPSRTFVYTMRPTRAGEAALPTVSIAAFDPSTQHYLTRVTPSLPVRVVAVPAFDPATIPDLGSTIADSNRRVMMWGAILGSAILVLGSAGAIVWMRRGARPGGTSAARRFAARTAHGLAVQAPVNPEDVALRVSSALIRYLQLGIGRPPGALTPDETREGVVRCTASEELGAQAAGIAERCDHLLYRGAPAPPEDPDPFRDDARALFTRLADRP